MEKYNNLLKKYSNKNKGDCAYIKNGISIYNKYKTCIDKVKGSKWQNLQKISINWDDEA